MASGTLPFSTYHRAQALGEGTYGSVVCVYNDAGEEMALKIFECDESNETLELGTLRELSILRLLRGSNSHPNIVEMVDVMEPGEEGDCSNGNLCMAMPLFRMGDMRQAIKTEIVSPGAAGRKQRVHIAHGLLSARYKIGQRHDNVADEESGDEDNIKPVLIDFSLAKFVDGQNAVLPPGSTHTGEVGTPTYVAPELVKKESYGLKSDMWSVGVVLLESLIGELAAEKDKDAARIIEEKKASLPESPYVNLIRCLLEPDVEKRLSAREALALPVFEKFNLQPPPVRILILTLLCLMKMTTTKMKMEQLDDELENISETQTLLDCIIIANKFYEQELIDIDNLAEEYPSFQDFDVDTFRDNEVALCSLMDYCLYLRS
ncbi:serine/threonine-protein kinase [Skeletonema marinoi]|uniref:Serine/threonine-protein kinase n=1 Tax=Skeletonema marinoi TaxID=267567 RepID=A0AAD9DGQ5_9STRA|nr:serine/threonine-protein kinase [Skeletonema marinoi]